MLSLIEYFDKRRGFALGFCAAGASLGTLAIPVLVEFFIRKYTWKGAILITGGIQLHCLIIGMLLRPVPRPVTPETCVHSNHGNNVKSSISSVLQLGILKDIKVVIYYIFIMLAVSAHFIPHSLLPARGISIRMPSEQAAFLVSVIGIGNLASPFAGFLGDRFRKHRTLIGALSAVLVGLLTFGSFFMKTRGSFYTYSALHGVLSGWHLNYNNTKSNT